MKPLSASLFVLLSGVFASKSVHAVYSMQNLPGEGSAHSPRDLWSLDEPVCVLPRAR